VPVLLLDLLKLVCGPWLRVFLILTIYLVDHGLGSFILLVVFQNLKLKLALLFQV